MSSTDGTPLLKLKDNAIFQLSLTSKELYHSNFLYWLGKNPNLKTYFQNIVLNLSDGKVDLSTVQYTVHREYRKLDFCVCDKVNGKERFLFVLENKFKSIPYIHQLDTYEKKCRSGGCSPYFLLLTLACSFADREEIESKNVWKIKDYGQLANILENHLPPKTDYCGDSFDIDVIRHYVDFIKVFSKEINANELSGSHTWKSFICNAGMEELRCGDIWQKIAFHIAAQRLASYINGERDFNSEQGHIFEDVAQGVKSKYYVGVKFFRTEGLLELKRYFKDGVILVLQQQGTDRLRLGIEVKDRQEFFGDPKYTKKPKRKKDDVWNNMVRDKFSDLGLQQYMPEPHDQCEFHAFEGGKGGFYYCHYGEAEGAANVEETLKKMVEIIDRICREAE